MSNSILLKLGFYRSVSCTPVKRLFKKNWSELFMIHQIDLSCSTPSPIVIGDSIAGRLHVLVMFGIIFSLMLFILVLEEIV